MQGHQALCSSDFNYHRHATNAERTGDRPTDGPLFAFNMRHPTDLAQLPTDVVMGAFALKPQVEMDRPGVVPLQHEEVAFPGCREEREARRLEAPWIGETLVGNISASLAFVLL